MNRPTRTYGIAFVLLFLLSSLACGLSAPSAQPKTAIAPIHLESDLTALDLCQAIPKEDIETVMGTTLANAPERFDFYGEPGASGCAYDAGKDKSGAAHFGYVVLVPIETYNNQPLYKNTDVKNLGSGAYFNNGADARQLWVKVDAKTAFVVAFGDEPKEAGALAMAKLVLAAISP